MENRAARYVNMALGVWLFVSAFLWHHSAAQFTNSLFMGLIALASAAIALRTPAFRFVNTAVGIWLVISAFVLPRVSAGTVWNDVLVGVATFYVSLVGPRTSVAGGTRLQPTA
jgi:hypothetical protein